MSFKRVLPAASASAPAASDGDAGSGTLAQSGYHYSLAGFSVSLRAQWATHAFRYLGAEDKGTAPPRSSTARALYDTGRFGVVGVAYTALANVDAELRKAVNASYRVDVGKVSSLTLSASRSLAPDAEASVMLAMSFPLEHVARMVVARREAANGIRMLRQNLASMTLAAR
jgi:hypothetical protein